jgi:hypothetical protein
MLSQFLPKKIRERFQKFLQDWKEYRLEAKLPPDVRLEKATKKKDEDRLHTLEPSVNKTIEIYNLARFNYTTSLQSSYGYEMGDIFDPKIIVIYIQDLSSFEILLKEHKPDLFAKYSLEWAYENFGQGVEAQVWFKGEPGVIITYRKDVVIGSAKKYYDFCRENSYALIDNHTRVGTIFRKFIYSASKID